MIIVQKKNNFQSSLDFSFNTLKKIEKSSIKNKFRKQRFILWFTQIASTGISDEDKVGGSLNKLVEMGGFEPPASTLRTWRSPN